MESSDNSSDGLPWVTVIIPAYNAATHLDETITSARAQTYPKLEIIIVDDGSRDNTLAVAELHARADGRVRVLTKENGGVASARNLGIRESKADFVALLDADDLWHPEKISRQVDVFLRGGKTVALVYNWFVRIDASGLMVDFSVPYREQGRVFEIMFDNKLIGNGSTPLMRRDVVLECGGYDSNLRAANSQGCEDLKLYLAIAEKYDFAVVPAYLTGYRILPRNMSSDSLQMIRSHRMVVDGFVDRCQSSRPFARRAHFDIMAWYTLRCLREKQFKNAGIIFVMLLKRFPAETLSEGMFSRRGVIAWFYRRSMNFIFRRLYPNSKLTSSTSQLIGTPFLSLPPAFFDGKEALTDDS